MKYVTALCIILALSFTAHGQQPATSPQAAAPNSSQPDLTGKRLQELRKSAYELIVAGKKDQAAEISKQAELERTALAKKYSELMNQAAQIRQAMGENTQILVHLKVIEIPSDKLQKAGYDPNNIFKTANATSNNNPKTEHAYANGVFDDDSKIVEILEKVGKENVKVLAEPTLVTINGRTASFHAGDYFQTKSEDGKTRDAIPLGTMFDFLPTVLENNKIRLEFHLRFASLDEKNSVRIGQDTMPGVHTMSCETCVEMNSRQTCVVCTQSQAQKPAPGNDAKTEQAELDETPFPKKSDKDVKTTLLVLVQPELVEPNNAMDLPVLPPR